MKRTISKMVDILFQQREGSWWLWPQFMMKVVGWKSIPSKTNRLQWFLYVEYRRKVVWEMNREIRLRGDCRELSIEQATKRVRGGVFWLTKEHAIPTILAKRLGGLVKFHIKTACYCRALSKALNAPAKQKEIAAKQEIRELRASARNTTQFTQDMDVKQTPLALMEPPK